MSKKKPENNSPVVIVAVIGALSTIFAAVIGSVANYNTEKLRQESELTRIALLSMPTTEISTQLPTATTFPLPTLPPDPTLPPALFFDDFKNGTKYWPLGDNSNQYWEEKRSVINGSYHWEITTFDEITAQLLSNTPAVSDFELQAELQIIDGTNFLYGLYFRESDNGGYYFLLDGKGNYELNLWNARNGEVRHKISWTFSPTINLQGSNNLKIVAQGAEIRLYINDNLVGDITDETFMSGQSGLAAALAKGQSVTLSMSNFKLILPQE
jgi:hypothetical protein